MPNAMSVTPRSVPARNPGPTNAKPNTYQYRLTGKPLHPSERPAPYEADHKKENELDEDEEEEETPTLKEYAFGLLRDVVIAIVIMIIIIGSLWAYTGNWPPMVVVESNSMMHGSDSSIGVIDTGDLVLVKTISDRSDVVPYWDGKKSSHETFGTHGDVIIFKKNGLDDTPVIHRAVLWIEYNASGNNGLPDCQDLGSFDIPSKGEYNVMETSIDNYVPKHFTLIINFEPIIQNFKTNNIKPHSGFITKGDNNDRVDQTSLTDFKGRLVEPIKKEWIVGKAEGELPWFGLIKLYISGDTSRPETAPPPTSRNSLIISIIIIIVVPIVIDILYSHFSKKKKDKKSKERLEPVREPRQPMPRTGPGRGPGSKLPPGTIRLGEENKNRRPVPGPGQPPQKLDSSQKMSKDDLFRKIK
jgi:signal peptidase